MTKADDSALERARLSAGRPKTESPRLLRIVGSEDASAERQVYTTLKRALMTGAIAPGARLTTRSLSEELGVSATPVREALKRLEGDGALVSRRKSAFVVNDPSSAELDDILKIRLVLEGLAIREAAAMPTVEKLEPAITANKIYLKTLSRYDANAPETLEANFRFHFEIYKLSGSEALVALIESLWLRIGPSLRHYAPDEPGSSIVHCHQRMIDSVAEGNPDAAEAALREDLTSAARSIMALMGE